MTPVQGKVPRKVGLDIIAHVTSPRRPIAVEECQHCHRFTTPAELMFLNHARARLCRVCLTKERE